MKQTLQLRLSQHLALTPQLQQSIRLLQLSTLELNQELDRFLQENPLLECEEEPRVETASEFPNHFEQTTNNVESPASPEEPSEFEVSSQNEVADTVTDRDWLENDSFGSGARDDNEESDYGQLAASSPSLREYLQGQLGLLQLPHRDRSLVSLLIEALDEDGHLTISLEELAENLPPELAIEPEELSIALRHLQYFDPPGIGARSLGECLELQLRALPKETPGREQAIVVVSQHLNLLAAKDYTKLKKLLRCDDQTLRIVQQLITGLNPRPGSAYSNLETRYVIPDVIVKKVKGMWLASLNAEAMPRLRINKMYANILQHNRDTNAAQLVTQLQEAKWLIKNVQQRFETILRVSQAIIDRQHRFFEYGEVAMRPLVLREIAEVLGLHESTISRVTTQKYMLTPRGIFELKYFFGSHVDTEAGGACSAIAIRALIKQLIASEDARKPLSDSNISDILAKQGIVVARRTIAKYRESLRIPAVNLRKSI